MIRFHLDENVDHAIARGLQTRGIDVTTASDAGLLSADDSEHLTFALKEGRVVFTQDADFLRLGQSDVSHGGIAYCAPQSRSIGYIVRFLCLMHDCMRAEELAGRIEYL